MKILAQFLKIPIITISQLNRNIETRSNKEPLLSDLKESGCIKLSSNINIKSKYAKDINTYHMSSKYKTIKLKIFDNTKKIEAAKFKRKQKYKKIHGYIKLFHKYIFHYTKQINDLMLTHNHKYLSQNTWITSNKILSCTKINYTSYKKEYLVYKQYIHNIYLSNYLDSYDISQNKCFNIISHNVVTHNSIEQDADIIITLFKKEDNKIYNSKTIDIKISKNRNGNTGNCKLVFIPEISLFQNVEKVLI